MSSLHSVIGVERDEVVKAWLDAVRIEFGHDEHTNVELRDHIPEFLDELTMILQRQHSGGPLPEVSDSARTHGEQRFRLGFNPFALVKEYGILRKAIMDAARRRGVTPTLDEFNALSEFITDGIARAVAQYSEERESEIRRQSQEHFAFVAHELRNPLLSAQLAFDVLQRQGVFPVVRQSEVLHKSLGRIGDLVERSLNIALLGSNNGPHCSEVNLLVLFNELVLESSPAADEKKITISVEASPVGKVSVDPRLLSSALANLIRNAIKFSHAEGRILVKGVISDSELYIEVEDSCGGLPSGKVDSLFTPFVQAGQDRSGFGLGLAIAKGAIENHGGQLGVFDRPGCGCTFFIRIPRA